MRTIHKKFVLDEYGKLIEIIISWKDYQEIEKLLDLEQNTIKDF